MARPASEKRTKNVGWRMDAAIVDAFARWCDENDKRPAKVLERLMAQASGFGNAKGQRPPGRGKHEEEGGQDDAPGKAW